MPGRCLTTSANPTTATSRDSTVMSHPAARMRSPPRPKKLIGRESARRRDSISCAPYCSPEASPAEMRMLGMRDYLKRALRMQTNSDYFEKEKAHDNDDSQENNSCREVEETVEPRA